MCPSCALSPPPSGAPRGCAEGWWCAQPAAPGIQRLHPAGPGRLRLPALPVPVPWVHAHCSLTRWEHTASQGEDTDGHTHLSSTVIAVCLLGHSLTRNAARTAAPAAGHAQLITQLVPLLRSTSDATRAYLCGLLWELATEPALAQQLLAAQAVAGLLRVVQDTSHAAGGGKKKKKGGSKKGGKEEAGGSGPVLQQDLEADPVLAASTALRNATGALHHLSFQDEAKLQLGTPAAVKLLSTLLRSADGQLYDNLVGVFWNMAMCADNKPVLAEANVPPFLAQPVPATQVLAIGV